MLLLQFSKRFSVHEYYFYYCVLCLRTELFKTKRVYELRVFCFCGQVVSSSVAKGGRVDSSPPLAW